MHGETIKVMCKWLCRRAAKSLFAIGDVLIDALNCQIPRVLLAWALDATTTTFEKCGTWQPYMLQLTVNTRVIDRSCRNIPLPARFTPKSCNECVLVKFEFTVNIMSYLVWQRAVVQTNTRALDKSACSVPSFCIVQNVALATVEHFSKIYCTIQLQDSKTLGGIDASTSEICASTIFLFFM